MGNTNCAFTSAYDADFDVDIYDDDLVQGYTDFFACRSELPRKRAQYSKEENFVQAHRSDKKCLIPHNYVSDAIVEQVEELIRREKWKNELPLAYSSSFSSMGSSVSKEEKHSEETSSKVDTSAPAPVAVVTTMVQATRKQENLNSQINPGHYEDSKRLGKIVQNIGNDGSNCDALAPLIAIGEDSEVSISPEIKTNMKVLHLKIPANLFTFYCTDLLKYHSLHKLTIAMTEGIQTTALSRSQHFNRNGRRIDDNVSSHSLELDFGVGPPSIPVRALVTNSVFADLALSGSLSLAHRSRQAHQIGGKIYKSSDQYIVLLNRRSGIPLAVCALKPHSNDDTTIPKVCMFTTRPRFQNQRRAISLGNLGLGWSDPNIPLFSWAEFTAEGTYPETIRYSIHLMSSREKTFEEHPSYRAVQASPGSPSIKVVGRTRSATCMSYNGCATATLCVDEVSKDAFFQLSVAKGVDPALMLCFIAFVDEAMEQTMRAQCISPDL